MTTPNFPNSGFIQILGGAAPPNTPLCYGPAIRFKESPNSERQNFLNLAILITPKELWERASSLHAKIR